MIGLNIPMPENCFRCPLMSHIYDHAALCRGMAWQKDKTLGESIIGDVFKHRRPLYCPLQEVPEPKGDEVE